MKVKDILVEKDSQDQIMTIKEHEKLEFKYKRTGTLFSAFLLMCGLIVLIMLIINLINKDYSKIEPRGVLGALILLSTGGLSTYFYVKKRNTTVFLDNNGIGQRNKTIKYFTWGDITSIEVFENNPYFFSSLYLLTGKSIFTLTIKSQSDQIKIGSEIENISKLIEYLKINLGAKFNTLNIPLEYKKVLK